MWHLRLDDRVNHSVILDENDFTEKNDLDLSPLLMQEYTFKWSRDGYTCLSEKLNTPIESSQNVLFNENN